MPGVRVLSLRTENTVLQTCHGACRLVYRSGIVALECGCLLHIQVTVVARVEGGDSAIGARSAQ